MTTLTTIDVTGMTCAHCVSAVTTELEKVDAVERVSVELHDGGTSHVTLFSDDELPQDALRAAVDEAGYEVTGISSHGAAQEFAQLAEVREQEAEKDS
ncbi:heavy-metal-associated domain-containing protein [Serinibacter arcticus]|uniref:Copper chaperone n=1 Tax=Serinibacter arcticus TaxID=1655435 RepID=A0A4Z1DZM2_9MICO|nr:cation transporter [Serinibacter arcticus]TGO03822.1 Copper chaperone [Serinibacter arcticus]